MGALTTPPGERSVVLALSDPIEPGHIPGLCRRVGLFLQNIEADVVVCDVSALIHPDAVTVDALARLQLTARRLGSRVGLIHACPQLQELLDLMGLGDVVPNAQLAVETRGQAEEREHPRGVEEEGDPADPAPG